MAIGMGVDVAAGGVSGGGEKATVRAVAEGGELLEGGAKLGEEAAKEAAKTADIEKSGRAPVEKGKAGEARSEAVAAGESVKGRQVTLEFPSGSRSRPDFVTETPNGELKMREAKNGEHARMTSGQRELEETIKNGDPVIPRGKNAENVGMKAGEPVNIQKFELDHYK